MKRNGTYLNFYFDVNQELNSDKNFVYPAKQTFFMILDTYASYVPRYRTWPLFLAGSGQLRCLELERALRIIVESVVNVNSTVVVVVLPAAVSASSMSTAPSSLVGENRERTAEFPADTTHLVWWPFLRPETKNCWL